MYTYTHICGNMHMHVYTFTRAQKCANVCVCVHVYMYAACISMMLLRSMCISQVALMYVWTREHHLHPHALQADRQMDR